MASVDFDYGQAIWLTDNRLSFNRTERFRMIEYPPPPRTHCSSIPVEHICRLYFTIFSFECSPSGSRATQAPFPAHSSDCVVLQALSKNGKVYGNGIMVGVQPCIDKV